MGKGKNMTEEAIFYQAIKKWGSSMQVILAIEELSELQQAICKSFRGHKNNIPEEIADVKIMLEQLEIIYNCKDQVEVFYEAKLDRLKRRIEEAEEK